MNTYDYTLVTDNYTAKGQVDAEDEAAAEVLLREQAANPLRPNTFTLDSDKKEPKPPKVKSVKLEFKTKVRGIADKPAKPNSPS